MDPAIRLTVIAPRWRLALRMTMSALIGPAALHAAEIYKSVDAEGHVTYSDRPAAPPATVIAEPTRETNDVAEMTATAAPPELPSRDQPPCPDEGYIWTPGYWSWDGVTYFWQPGVWLFPPQVGVFWTPGYWAYAGTVFIFHRGYWGPQVGYYGGINYGFGYWGNGYGGGHWEVSWAPSTLHPQMRVGLAFARTRTWPSRASILGANGQVLVGGGEVVEIGVEPRG